MTKQERSLSPAQPGDRRRKPDADDPGQSSPAPDSEPGAGPGGASVTEGRWAAIDVGSDTVHLLVARLRRRHDGSLEVRHVDSRSRLMELGRQVDRRGAIGRDAGELRGILERYVRVAHRADARIVIGATEASRRASDGPAVLESIAREVGIPIRILSGRREAQLGFLAAGPWLAPMGPQLLIDSGGASTEVSATDGAELVESVSVPLGAASMADRLPGDPPSALEWALEAVHFGRLLAGLPAFNPAAAWVTGGSAHNLVGLEDVKGAALETRMTMGELDRVADQLLRTTARKLARRSGEDPRRVALLAPGALIIAAILRHYGLETCTVIPAGVRDGMLLAAATVGDEWWMETPAAPAAAPVPPRAPQPSAAGASTPEAGSPESRSPELPGSPAAEAKAAKRSPRTRRSADGQDAAPA